MEFNNNRSCWELLILYWASSCVGLGCKLVLCLCGVGFFGKQLMLQ
jgi:hypothetical protein